MAVTTSDAVAQWLDVLEANGFGGIRAAEYPRLRKIELDSFQYDAVADIEGIPHTIGSFVWYNPRPVTTPVTKPYTQCALRPLGQCRLIEFICEVMLAGAVDVIITLYKNNVLISTVTITAGQRIARTTTISDLGINRDDFLAYKLSVGIGGLPPEDLSVVVRMYQYPYVMADPQAIPPMPT